MISPPTSKPKPSKASNANKKLLYKKASPKSKSSSANEIPAICDNCKKFNVVYECPNLDCIQLRKRYLCTPCDRSRHLGVTTEDHKRNRISRVTPAKSKQPPQKKAKRAIIISSDEEDNLYNEFKAQSTEQPTASKKIRKNVWVSDSDSDEEENEAEIHYELPKSPSKSGQEEDEIVLSNSPPSFNRENRSRTPSPIPKSNNDGQSATFSSSTPSRGPTDVMI